MISQMILQVMLVFSDEDALRTEEKLLWLDVASAVLPELQLSHGHELALLTFKGLNLPLGVNSRHANLNIIISQIFSLLRSYDNDLNMIGQHPAHDCFR